MIAINEDYYESGEIIALVGCGKQKRDDGETHYAKDLYTSTYFTLKRRVSESYADRWYILSAEHGLIAPNYPIGYYNTSMSDLDSDDRAVWGETVAGELDARADEFEESPAEVVAVFAGKDYYDPLRDALDEDYPLPLVRPFAGLGLGSQLAYMKETLREVPGDQSGISDYTEGGA